MNTFYDIKQIKCDLFVRLDGYYSESELEELTMAAYSILRTIKDPIGKQYEAVLDNIAIAANIGRNNSDIFLFDDDLK